MSTFQGSCLCSEVTYEIEGEAIAFFHCHCSRCRRSSGTGHASNVRIQAEKINWTKGESLVKTYKVPEAERFKTVFCSQCGSALPRHFPNHGFVILPAGTLDTAPEIRPQGRIFNASRASWSCRDDLPVHDEYPVQK